VIRDRIRRVGGDPEQVTICAVTKGRTAAECGAAIAAGLKILGENRVAEALAKQDQVDMAEWHLIGHLQTNKVKAATGRFALVQSVDSIHLAESIAARDPGQPVLLEVNAAREPAKDGFDPEAVIDAARRVSGLLPLRGLMGMGPLAGDPAPVFAELARLRLDVEQAIGRSLPVLSMGMSGDFEVAVGAGATMLRLGRILFENN